MSRGPVCISNSVSGCGTKGAGKMVESVGSQPIGRSGECDPGRPWSFFGGFDHPDKVAKELVKTGHSQDPYLAEALAFTLARRGKTREALETIGRLQGMLDSKNFWHHNLSAKVKRLEIVLVEDTTNLKKTMDSWFT